MIVRPPPASAVLGGFVTLRERPPMGTEQLIRTLKNRGLCVFFSDYCRGLERRPLRKVLDEEKPDIVGVYCDTSNFSKVFGVCAEAKSRGLYCVLGGPGAASSPKKALAETGADRVIAGPTSSLELLALCKGEKISQLSGKIRLKKDPLYSKMPGIFSRSGIIRASEGCPYNCSFCRVPKISGKWSAASPSSVADAFEILASENVKFISFNDDCFGAGAGWLNSFCNEIFSRGLERKVSWSCHTRADLFTLRDFKLMKRAGCRVIFFGVESGSARILRKMNKAVSLERIRLAFFEAKKAGLETGAYFIVGYPGETKKDLDLTRNFIFEIGPDNFNFFNYSPLGLEDGILRKLPGRTFGKLSPEQIFDFKKRAIIDYYSRPNFVLETLGRSKSPSGFLVRMRPLLSALFSFNRVLGREKGKRASFRRW